MGNGSGVAGATAIPRSAWLEAQCWERNWWGNCANTFLEEQWQVKLLPYLGLQLQQDWQFQYIELGGRSVVDLGGGPVSLLLKARNGSRLTVVDPCPYPDWVYGRYASAGIEVVRQQAELFRTDQVYDEAWLYNVLQHTEDPAAICRTARSVARLIRVAEWIETDPPNVGHPHVLDRDRLDEWLGGTGQVIRPDRSGLRNVLYYGIFLGESYSEPLL